MKALPDFKFELPLWERGLNVLGIDEAGRGAFAGPLAVGGVIFSQEFTDQILPLGINDSKLLSPKKREFLFDLIKKYAVFSHVEFVPLDIINKIGIGKATYLGMEKVIEIAKIKNKKAKIFNLIDGFEVSLKVPQKAIIKGDTLSVSIAAASILAKVERDKLMTELGKKFPNYGFELHKGYGTKYHRDMIKNYGVCEHHRTQFVKAYV